MFKIYGQQNVPLLEVQALERDTPDCIAPHNNIEMRICDKCKYKYSYGQYA